MQPLVLFFSSLDVPLSSQTLKICLQNLSQILFKLSCGLGCYLGQQILRIYTLLPGTWSKKIACYNEISLLL